MQECAAHRDTRHVRRAVKWATCRREFSHPIDRRNRNETNKACTPVRSYTHTSLLCPQLSSKECRTKSGNQKVKAERHMWITAVLTNLI